MLIFIAHTKCLFFYVVTVNVVVALYLICLWILSSASLLDQYSENGFLPHSHSCAMQTYCTLHFFPSVLAFFLIKNLFMSKFREEMEVTIKSHALAQ